MRKFILAIASIIAINVNVYCQESIPDGGFENCWENKQIPGFGDYEDFKDDYFFNTLNILHVAMDAVGGNAPLTAFKDSNNVSEGNYALKLVSDSLMVSPMIGGKTVFLPGVMGNIALNIIETYLSLGRSFTSRPAAIKGWHKYEPVDGDSAAIEIWLEKNGTILGSGKQLITSAVSTWSQFNVPINYTSNETPDKIVVLFASSAKYDLSGGLESLMECEGQAGSALYLDDLELDYSVGIKEMLYPEITMQVYPNPSKEQITVQMAKETKGTVIVYDYLARKIGEYPINGTQTTIDIQNYAQGSYLLNVVENNKTISTNRFVKD
ncbi:MAG: PCMD domain-containing protein [Bacteroidales bacterium]|nr:PCMD domain-containing protein [Bacteroidales bacterium]